MIELTSGDILKDDSDAIINTVNCVGVMGRGLALQFKNAWPENFKAYEAACKREEVQPGRMFIYDTGQLTSPRYIINFPTKRHWRWKSRMQDIDAGLTALVRDVNRLGIRSLAIPPPLAAVWGAWIGARCVPVSKPPCRRCRTCVSASTSTRGAPQADKMQHVRDVPRMTAGGRAALVELMNRHRSPVRGGHCPNPELDREARLIVARMAGHSRVKASSAIGVPWCHPTQTQDASSPETSSGNQHDPDPPEKE